MADTANSRPVTVMTRNLYLGADLGPTMRATTKDELKAAVASVFSVVEKTNFPERAEVLAKEIVDIDPLLVGLQEAAGWFSGPHDDLQTATVVEFDFLKALRKELACLGAVYDVVVVQPEADLEAPAGPPYSRDFRLVQHDAILVKAGLGIAVELRNVQSRRFRNLCKLTNGLKFTTQVKRGWVSVDVTVEGCAFRFVNTHLEAFDPRARLAQARELIAADGPVGSATMPVILVGDFNSGLGLPGPGNERAYAALIDHGLIDAWSATHPGNPGFTHEFSELLDSASPDVLKHAIDHVLVTRDVGVAGSSIFGTDPAKRTVPGGMWPSDHAGVAATLAVPVRPQAVPPTRITSNPLTLIMSIRPGIPVEALAKGLEDLREPIQVALDGIGTVHNARFQILDLSSRSLSPKPGSTGPFKLAVITSYDGEFRDYIEDFAIELSAVFDQLLLLTDDGADVVPVRDHLDEFVDWVAARDAAQNWPHVEPEQYAAYPESVQQVKACRPSKGDSLAPGAPPRLTDEVPRKAWDDIQGTILRGYRGNYARHLVLSVTDVAAARAFLRSLVDGTPGVPQISTAEDWKGDKPASFLNLGITFAGLQQLGVTAEHLATFPEEFRLGATHATTKRRVGDVGQSDSAHWKAGLSQGDDVHVILSLWVQDSEQERDDRTEELRAAFAAGCRELGEPLDAETLPPDRNVVHFGYHDNLSQPVIAGAPLPKRFREATTHIPVLPAGTVLLGYRGPLGNVPRVEPEDLSTNSSFGAFRVLAQDVRGFDEFLQSHAEELDIDPELLAAKVCGRWRDGTPLALSPGVPDLGAGLSGEELNDFDYLDDPYGYRCPIGSHIRRANPRSDPVIGMQGNGHLHRVVRRGMPYGPPFDRDVPDTTERGMVGYFIGANLRRQFEFLMGAWLNSSTHVRAPRQSSISGQDVFMGVNDPGKSSFTMPSSWTEEPPIEGFSRFVSTRGGAYCYLPSITALKYLAALT